MSIVDHAKLQAEIRAAAQMHGNICENEAIYLLDRLAETSKENARLEKWCAALVDGVEWNDCAHDEKAYHARDAYKEARGA